MVDDGAGFFSRSSSNFFWRLLMKTAKQLARRVGGATARWASGGLAKTSRRGKQEWRYCQIQKYERLGNGNTTGGFPFL
jgi:hypothetical protein